MELLPSQQWIVEEDNQSVVESLNSGFLTTGPQVDQFEKKFAQAVGTPWAVSLSHGTAALHAALFALDIQPGDEVLVPSMTFAATANAVLYQGGTPIFVDVDPNTLLIDPQQLKAKITTRTKAVMAVDYAGQPCDYDALRAVTDAYHLPLVADACHSLGGQYKSRSVGSLADLNVFSFHPVKPITTGEGGMVTTANRAWADRIRLFRNHGITQNSREREEKGTWYYEMQELGYNYRLTDFQCALGLSQLARLNHWIHRRHEIVHLYHRSFQNKKFLTPLHTRPDVFHAHHIYVIQVTGRNARKKRDLLFTALRNKKIPVNVHYIPVHLHPYYRRRLGTGPGLCPQAEQAFERILSLPVYPRMSNEEAQFVVDSVLSVMGHD